MKTHPGLAPHCRRAIARAAVLAALLAAALAPAAGAAAATAAADAKLAPRLAAALAAGGPGTAAAADREPTFTVWVRFADKGVAGSAREAALREAAAALTDPARARRARRAEGLSLVDDDDLPLAAPYVAAVGATGARVRQKSRWLNAVSAEATAAQVAALARLPFVAGLDLVRRGAGTPPAPLAPVADLPREAAKSGGGFAYGPGAAQLEAINVPAAHARGLTGAGVTVAIFDTGFDVTHEAVAGADIAATWNFLADTPDVGPVAGEDRFQVLHGTAVLSLLAARSPGLLYGSAPDATYLLAKTEDVSSESHAEEDNWIAALEWAEGLGVDVVSSSVGYYEWYDFAYCNGTTTAITVAAELAAARGVCVVNSVGNERQNPDWPHLIPPADGRHVIAVGATSAEGLVTAFSSPGPTADGRHKPDVMGRGVGLLAALGGTGNLYGAADGVDYGVAVVAGAVALVLERNPGLTPGEVLAALHATASRAAAPDDDYGWGQVDADAACEYGRPVIAHAPLGDHEAAGSGYPVVATITAAAGVATASSFVAWRRDTNPWQMLPLQAQGGGSYRAVIPPQAGSGVVQYYLVAEDLAGRSTVEPLGGAGAPHTFRVGVDTQPPVLAHVALADQVPAQWPPLLVVRASDNVGVAVVSVAVTVNGTAAGTSALAPVGDHWEAPFPVAAGNAPVGATLGYRFTATDAAAAPNLVVSPAYSFRVVADRGDVLLVDDRAGSAKVAGGREGAPVGVADKSLADLAGWLADAGFAVTSRSAGSVQAADLIGRDLVVLTCGLNPSPLANGELRDALVDYATAGGRVLVEGGEVGYACIGEGPTYPEFAEFVLRAEAYLGEEAPSLWAAPTATGHSFLHRPYDLADGLPVADTGAWYGAADVMAATTGAVALMHPPVGLGAGGVIVHDDNACPDAGQSVYFAFDLGRLAAGDARQLLVNAATWLTFREPPGAGSIIGRVFLPGSQDYSGLTVRTQRGLSAVVRSDGTYRFGGLWDGTFVVTASAPGYGPATQATTLAVGGQAALNFQLEPVVTVSGTAAPNLAIPDNNETGIASVIHLDNAQAVHGVEVDIDLAHFSIGQLTVELVGPSGAAVTLHDRTGGVGDDIIGTWPTTLYVDGPGALADFDGAPAAGDWTLRVVDHVFGASGRLRSWGLRLLVGVAPAASGVDMPAVTRLAGVAPNPFNPSTTMSFSLGAPARARLGVYDARGRLVRRLVDEALPAGNHARAWDGRDDAGARAASGVYFARLDAGDVHDVLKLVLVK